MQNPITLPPLTRFSITLDGLCKALAARIGPCLFPPYVPPLLGPFIIFIYNRIRRAERRFKSLAARIQSGRFKPRPPNQPGNPAQAQESHRTRPRAPRLRWRPAPVILPPGFVIPRRFAWLLPLIPCHAACFANQLRHLLTTDPEMQAILATAPHAAKILAPLCRMLGIEPQDLLPNPAGRMQSATAPLPLTALPDRLPTADPPTPAPHLPPNTEPRYAGPPYLWPYIPT